MPAIKGPCVNGRAAFPRLQISCVRRSIENMSAAIQTETVAAQGARAENLRFADLAIRGKNGLWRYVLAAALIFVLGFSISVALVALYDAFGFDVSIPGAGAVRHPLSLTQEALQFALIFASVIAFLPGLWLVLPWLHKRARLTFLTAHARFSWARLWLSFGAAMAIFLASLFFVLARDGGPPALHVEPARYLVFIALGILLVPAQVFTEELLFRGYLTQAVGRVTGSLALRLFIPAALFVGLHLANPEVSHNALAAVAGYALVALYLGVLTLRGNGLEEAIGFHLANNLFVLLVVGGTVTAAPSAAPLVVEPSLKAVLIVEPILYGCHYVLLFALLGGFGLARAESMGSAALPLALSPARENKAKPKPPPPAATAGNVSPAPGAPAAPPSPAAWKAMRDGR